MFIFYVLKVHKVSYQHIIYVIFDELLNESLFVFFKKINIAVGFRVFTIQGQSQRDIFLALSVHPSVHTF